MYSRTDRGNSKVVGEVFASGDRLAEGFSSSLILFFSGISIVTASDPEPDSEQDDSEDDFRFFFFWDDFLDFFFFDFLRLIRSLSDTLTDRRLRFDRFFSFRSFFGLFSSGSFRADASDCDNLHTLLDDLAVGDALRFLFRCFLCSASDSSLDSLADCLRLFSFRFFFFPSSLRDDFFFFLSFDFT